ncbi:MAG: transposase [Candidatus Bathyarchaeia archaeon]
MKQTLLVKLMPNPEQAKTLYETMETFNNACNEIADVAFEHRTTNKIRLQKLVYYKIRRKYGLSAQLTIRTISKVAEAYKRGRKVKLAFRGYGAIVYDQRILSWKGVDRVSMLTLKGRELIPVKFGIYQAERLNRIRGQADLILRKGIFYLAVVVDVPELPAYDEAYEAKEWLGVDLGIKNIATDSDGKVWSGNGLNGIRKRYAKLRAKLQSKGTKSARRLLKRRSGKESRFARNVNHIISKRLVAKAKGTERGIALEDLTGIRSRITVRKPQRRTQHSWSFRQLRQFIEYKAKLAGVPIRLVDPKNTSCTCPNCGFVSRLNRRGERFHCGNCGYVGFADHIAALNIRGRAAVNQPYVSGDF